MSYYIAQGNILNQSAIQSVQSLSRVRLFATPWIAADCPSPTPRVYSNSCPLSWWCHPAISSSVVPFSSCPQSLPASGSFPISQLFAWGGQSIGVSASASVLPVNTQDYTQYHLINHKGKEYERECICIPGSLCCKQRLTQHCKSATLQWNFLNILIDSKPFLSVPYASHPYASC